MEDVQNWKRGKRRMKEAHETSTKEQDSGDTTDLGSNKDNKVLEKLKEKYDLLVENTVKLLADNELLHAELDKLVRDNSRLKTGNKLTGMQPIAGRENLSAIDVTVDKGGYSFIIVAVVAIICYYFGKFSKS